MTRIQAGRSGVGIPVGARDFFFSRLTLCPTQHPIQQVAKFFSGSKAAGRKVDHSPPSGAEALFLP